MIGDGDIKKGANAWELCEELALDFSPYREEKKEN